MWYSFYKNYFAFSIKRLTSLQEEGKKSRASSLDDSFEPWSAKRADILAKYTTSEKLSITTSFLSTADKEQGGYNLDSIFFSLNSATLHII